MIKNFYTLIFIVTLPLISCGQQNTDTVGVIGKVLLDKSNVDINKSVFLKVGKISTNINGVYVKQFNYSLFTLGHSVSGVNNDSIFNNDLIKYVSDKNLNYRYVNFDKIKLIDSVGNVFCPKVSSVKIKFRYK